GTPTIRDTHLFRLLGPVTSAQDRIRAPLERARSRDLSAMQLWYRVGETGQAFRGTRQSHSFTTSVPGWLYLDVHTHQSRTNARSSPRAHGASALPPRAAGPRRRVCGRAAAVLRVPARGVAQHLRGRA